MEDIGKWIIVLGGILIIIGIIVFFAGDKMSWIGRLPGDIRIENKNTRIYIPIMTMIIFSILLSLVMYLIRWLGK